MHTATLAKTHTHFKTHGMLAEEHVQLVCPLYRLHLPVSERHPARPAKSWAAVFGFPGLSRPVMVQTPLGPWSPGDLFLAPAWGMLGVRALSYESGQPQTGSLGVKKGLGGWRNQGAGRESLSVCVYMFTICTCPFRFPPPPTSAPRGNNPCLCEHLQARRLCLLSFLAPSVLAAFVHLGTKTASVGVLQAVGVVCAPRLSLFLRCQVTLTLLKKNTDHTLPDPSCRTNTSLSQNRFMNSVLVLFE